MKINRRAEREARAWNAAHPVGTPVRYWTGAREGEGKRGETRGPAVVMSDHASVWVTGLVGSVALSHVEPEATYDPARLRWEINVRGMGSQRGIAVAHGLRLQVMVVPRGMAAGSDRPKWTASLRLTRGMETIAKEWLPANSWQACRSWATRRVAELFAEKGGAK